MLVLSWNPENPNEMPSRYEEEILRSLRRIVRAIDLHSRQLASEHGLTSPQLVCLREIAAAETITPSQLARLVDLSQATVTGITDRLVRNGLVTRTRSEQDRRRVLLAVTDRGQQMVAKAPSPLQEQLAHRLEALPTENQLIIRTVLQQVVSLMGAEAVDAAALLASGPPMASADDTEAFLEEVPANVERLESVSRRKKKKTSDEK